MCLAWGGLLGVWLLAGMVSAQAVKPGGDQAAWQKRLEEMAARTEQSHKTAPASNVPSAQPPAPAAPPPPELPAQAAPELFEDDFDKTGAISFTQRRMVLLVFAPQVETDAWRTSSELESWARRVVICPVHEGALGDRAQRLAKAFGMDVVKGGMLTALVRAPDGVRQVTGDELLYQVLGRYPAPRDVAEVLAALQEGAAAYEVKKGQHGWDAVLSGQEAPAAPAMTPPATSSPAAVPPSAFEQSVLRAWQSRRPVMLVFPGPAAYDGTKLAEAWRAMPEALAPELLVLTPGSADGNIGGKPVDWEAFFDVGGRYPQLVMILPDHAEGGGAPAVADMSYRVIARREGEILPEKVNALMRRWMSEDFDAVMMRAWVLRRPMLLVFPPADNERALLDSPQLAKMEEHVAVFVNTKDAVSGIRRRTPAQIEKEFATEGVERAELVLLKLTTTVKDASAVRLDQIQASPVNRSFAKKSPEKILEWAASRAPAKPAGTGTGN